MHNRLGIRNITEAADVHAGQLHVVGVHLEVMVVRAVRVQMAPFLPISLVYRHVVREHELSVHRVRYKGRMVIREADALGLMS